ncbi:MAG: hypothetical protein ACPG1A_13340 [Halioglobus sp.]
MPFAIKNLRRLVVALVFPVLSVSLGAGQAQASGEIGEHVNDLSSHLDQYTKDVNWLIGKVDGIVDAYEKGGLEAAQPDKVVDHWEAVDFHSAIETNYIPLYGEIWQGLFGVRMAIEKEQPVAEVRAEQATLEQALWQSLGAVKVAAQFQKRGMLPAVENTEAASPVETVDIINRNLDRVVAKYAEKLPDDALEIVQSTYLNRFEGIEGDLIALDADLVEDLEVDFNVRLQKAIKDGKSLDDVRAVVVSMQGKLDTCRALLEGAENNRSEVF